MKKELNQLAKGDIFMIMMISKCYFKQKSLVQMTSWGDWEPPRYGGGGGGMLGVMGPHEIGGCSGTMNYTPITSQLYLNYKTY